MRQILILTIIKYTNIRFLSILEILTKSVCTQYPVLYIKNSILKLEEFLQDTQAVSYPAKTNLTCLSFHLAQMPT